MKNGWKATTEDAAAHVPEGAYNCTVAGIQDMAGQHGLMVRIEFKLCTEDEWDERQVSGIANKKLCENTKLGRWVAAIIGRAPAVGEEITIEDLLYKPCRVVVKHKTNSDGIVFANVVEVLTSDVPF